MTTQKCRGNAIVYPQTWLEWIEALTDPKSVIFIMLVNWVMNRMQDEHECTLCLQEFVDEMMWQQREEQEKEESDQREYHQYEQILAAHHKQLFAPKPYVEQTKRKEQTAHGYEEKILILLRDQQKAEKEKQVIEDRMNRLKQTLAIELERMNQHSQERQTMMKEQMLDALQNQTIKVYNQDECLIPHEKAQTLIKEAPALAPIGDRLKFNPDLLKQLEIVSEAFVKTNHLLSEFNIYAAIARCGDDQKEVSSKDLLAIIKANKPLLGQLIRTIYQKQLIAEAEDVEALIHYMKKISYFKKLKQVSQALEQVSDNMEKILAELTHYRTLLTQQATPPTPLKRY